MFGCSGIRRRPGCAAGRERQGCRGPSRVGSRAARNLFGRAGERLPGIGWIIFRERSDLPEELVFTENYLGKTDETFTLNFSTGSAMVLAQYYNFVRFGHEGYAYIMGMMQRNSRFLGERIGAMDEFELIGTDEEQLPLVAFKLAEERNYDEFDVAGQLAAERAGWCPPTRSRRTPRT